MSDSIGEKVVVYMILVTLFGAFVLGVVGYALGWTANEKKYIKEDPDKQSWPEFCEALRTELLACITCNYISAPMDDTMAEKDDLKRRKMHELRALRPAAERRSTFTVTKKGPVGLDEEQGGGGAPRESSTRVHTEKSEGVFADNQNGDLKDNLYQAPVEADQVSEAVGNGNASDGSTGSAGGKSVASSRATSSSRKGKSGSRKGTDLDSTSLDRPPTSKKRSSGVQESKG